MDCPPRPLRRFGSSLALASAAGLIVAPAARAGDWYVDASASNCATATGGPSDPFCAIGDALAVAVDGDTLHVAAGNYLEHLVVAADLTIVGTSGASATAIDGEQLHRVLDVAPGATVTLEGLSIRNGMADVGAGIRVGAGASLVLQGCAVTANDLDEATFLPERGAGIAVDHGSLEVIESEIRGNSASHDGGGIYNDGGAVVVTNSTISGNEAGALERMYLPWSEARGGGICSVGGTLTLSNSTLAGNAAGIDDYYSLLGFGGGVCSIDGVAVIEDCTFTGGLASVRGGAVDSLGTALTIVDSILRDNVAGDGGGVSIHDTTQATIERTSIVANGTVEATYWFSSGAGGALVAGDAFLTGTSVLVRECDLTGNLGFDGGAIANRASLTLERCTVNDNVADDYHAIGGAIFNYGSAAVLTLIDCEVAGNRNIQSTLPRGGGIANYKGASLTLVNTTVAGNRCELRYGGGVYGEGGGIYDFQSTIALHSSIVAGNLGSTNDVDGAVTSHGHNCIGDTSAATITSLGTGDLLDVDPQFADPANGDWSLAATSPCIDAGDPALAPTGRDVGTNPRLLDGDLDRRRVLDPGAREFSHVRLAVTGSPTPGGTLTLDTSGTSGLLVFLLAGVAESELAFQRYGALFVDLASPWLLVPWGTIPSTVQAPIDPSLPVPLTVLVQQLAIDSPSGAGNFGNLVTLEFE